MTQRFAGRRGLVQSGTTGVTGYQYRSTDPTVQIVTRSDGTKVIEGAAAVYNRYSANLGGFVEQIRPNAFTESLSRDDQIASYNHEYATLLGRSSAGTLTIDNGDDALRYSVPYDSEDPDHQRVARKIERGDLRGSSFTFAYVPDGETWSYTDQGMLLCTVERAGLLEVAPVVWPAYPATEEDEFAVSLRSLAAQSGRDLGDLVDAARSGRLTEVVGNTIAPDPVAEAIEPPNRENTLYLAKARAAARRRRQGVSA